MASELFRVGDRVSTKTDAVYQDTQESLSELTGVVVNIKDPYDIHVRLDNKSAWGLVGFSEFELTKINKK